MCLCQLSVALRQQRAAPDIVRDSYRMVSSRELCLPSSLLPLRQPSRSVHSLVARFVSGVGTVLQSRIARRTAGPRQWCVRACRRTCVHGSQRLSSQGEKICLFTPACLDPCLQANALVIPRWDCRPFLHIFLHISCGRCRQHRRDSLGIRIWSSDS